MSSKVRFYLLVIHPQVYNSMEIWACNIFSLDAANKNWAKPNNTVHCVNMISCLYSTVQLILPCTSPSQISKSQSHGHKYSPVEVHMEL
jgi:hypothetical protein